jgi:LmbE family N-acetylglucosaminyl deacetylase
VLAARDHLFFPEQLAGGLKHHRVKCVLLFGTGEPNLWFDIAPTLETKLQALRRHRSQLRQPRSVESRIRQWAGAQGRPWGLGPAEGFRYIELG